MMFPKKVSCVIFDMDGVIIDSEEIHKKAYYQTFDYVNVSVSDDLYKTLTGSSTINAFQKLVSIFNLQHKPEDLVNYKRAIYVDFFENDKSLHLVAGVHDLIKYLHNKKITLVLASSSAMVNINRVFKRFELDQYFTKKISGADLTASKPHPEIFEKAALLAKTDTENCVVIEDSDNGIKAANDAGIFVFGYQNKMATDQTLVNADLIINDFKKLKAYL